MTMMTLHTLHVIHEANVYQFVILHTGMYWYASVPKALIQTWYIQHDPNTRQWVRVVAQSPAESGFNREHHDVNKLLPLFYLQWCSMAS
jgi:hypothetical protein